MARESIHVFRIQNDAYMKDFWLKIYRMRQYCIALGFKNKIRPIEELGVTCGYESSNENEWWVKK